MPTPGTGPLAGRAPQLTVALFGAALATLGWFSAEREDRRALTGTVLAATVALCGYLDILRTKRREVERLVAERTRQLAAANGALAAGGARLHRQIETLGRLPDAARSVGRNTPAALQHVAERIAHTLDVARVGVWRFTADRAAIRCVAQYGAATGGELRAADFPAYFAALGPSRLIDADDARTDPRTREFAGPYLVPLGITAMLDAPLFLAGVCDGVLCCEHVGPPRAWTVDEKGFALAAANLVSMLVEGGERWAAEERFRVLVENAFDGVTCYDRTGRIIYVSPGNVRIDGRTAAETLGTDGFELIHPDDQPMARAMLAELVANPGERVSAEVRTTHKSGPLMWVEGTARFVPDLGDGTVVLNWRDVTGRKRAEQALRQSEERFRLVWESAADGMRLTDEGGTIHQVNPALCRLVELPAQALVGGPMSTMYPVDRAAHNLARHRERFLSGTHFTSQEMDVTLWNGRRVWFEVTHRPLPPTVDQPPLLLTIYRDITARKRQARLMEQTHRAARVGGWELDFVSGHLTWTEETYRIHEVAPAAFAPTLENAIGFYAPEAVPVVTEAIRRSREFGEPWELELELITAKGNRVWAHAVGEVEIQDGQATRAYGSFQDITARKRAEAQLRQTAAQLRAALALGRMGSFRWEAASGAVAWSPELYAVYGVRPDTPITFEGYIARVHPDDRARVLETVGGVASAGGSFAHQYRIVRPDGEVRWVMARGDAGRNPGGAVTGLEGVCQDITEQKEAEEAIRRLNEGLETRVAERTAELRAANEQLAQEVAERARAEEAVGRVSAFREAIIRTAAEGICVCEVVDEYPHVRFSVWNERMTEITGYAMDEINRTGWYQTLYPDPDVRDRAAARMARMRDGDDLVAEEWVLTRKDGTVRTATISTSRVELDGRPSVVALISDVSERKRAEEERARNVNLLQAVTEGTQDAVFVKDLDGRYLFINTAGAAYFGRPPAAVVGRTDAELAPPESAAQFAADDRDATTAGEMRTYEETLSVGGTTHTFWTTKGPYRDGGGRVIGSIGVGRNITERKRIEERLRASLREKETLLREVHHRVKNNLQIIASLLYFQGNKLQDARGAAVINECRDRLRSMVLIHQKLYQAGDLSRVDLADYTRTLVNELQASYATLCPHVITDVSVDPLRFPSETALPVGMLICELVTNAFKYAFPGARAGAITVALAGAADGRTTLTVADDGVGLPPGFEPGRAGAFGWQLVEGLARQLGAELTIGPAPGTRVTVAIPPPVG